jgi:hypothetical protein
MIYFCIHLISTFLVPIRALPPWQHRLTPPSPTGGHKKTLSKGEGFSTGIK